jgi:hypothetical protein
MWERPGRHKALLRVGSSCLGPSLQVRSRGGCYECAWIGGGLARLGDALHTYLHAEEGRRVPCADELRLMGVRRDDVLAAVGRAGGGEGSLARKTLRACAPLAMKRISRGPWVDGANWTMQLVASDGRLRERRCSLVGRSAVTKGTVLSRMVIGTAANPRFFNRGLPRRCSFSGPIGPGIFPPRMIGGRPVRVLARKAQGYVGWRLCPLGHRCPGEVRRS